MKSVITYINALLDKVFDHTDCVFRTVLGVSFLPERCRRWLFDTGTSLFEIIHAILIICWGMMLIAQPSPSLLLPTYDGFLRTFGQNYQSIFGMLGLVLGVITLAVKIGPTAYTRRGRIIVGFVMFLSALLWTVVGGAFLYNYPPVSSGMVFYTVVAVFCYFTGEHIMYGVHQQDLIRGDRNNSAVSSF